MLTAILLVSLISTLAVDAAKDPIERRTIVRADSNGARLRNLEDSNTPIRFPRRFASKETPTTRLHIKNQTGFDGKVHTILVNEPENQTGVHAYGIPKKHLEDNGLIETVPAEPAEANGNPRPARLVEAYGMSKHRLTNNGHIERVVPSSIVREETGNTVSRVSRSIDAETKNEKQSEADLEDLEAQDAKVFRPLFVHRQQVAKRQRQHRARNQIQPQWQKNYTPYYRPAVY